MHLKSTFLYGFITAVANQLNKDVQPIIFMGSEIDCQKLSSSMTLFNFIADKLDDQDLKDATKNVLSQLASHAWTECTKTLDWLRNFSEDSEIVEN